MSHRSAGARAARAVEPPISPGGRRRIVARSPSQPLAQPLIDPPDGIAGFGFDCHRLREALSRHGDVAAFRRMRAAPGDALGKIAEVGTHGHVMFPWFDPVIIPLPEGSSDATLITQQPYSMRMNRFDQALVLPSMSNANRRSSQVSCGTIEPINPARASGSVSVAGSSGDLIGRSRAPDWQ